MIVFCPFVWRGRDILADIGNGWLQGLCWVAKLRANAVDPSIRPVGISEHQDFSLSSFPALEWVVRTENVT
jgi:hypothetical protein